MFADDDQKPEAGKAALAGDDIVCEKAKEEFDDELEEGEIVDDDSDCEHEKFENVELFREAEHKRETLPYGGPAYVRFPKYVRMPDAGGSPHRGVKRNVDEDCWAEGDMGRYDKRRRLEETDERETFEFRNERVNRNNCYAAPTMFTVPDDDGYGDRETYDSVEPESYPREFENERRSFRPMRHDRYGRINGDCGTRSRYAPATPSTMRRPRRPVVGPAKTGQKVMELCRFYRMNRQCYKQERCLYMHGDFPCRFYHAGKRCNRGEQCRYSHAEIDVNKKQLLLKNTFEQHQRPFVQNDCDVVHHNHTIPSLLEMQIPIPAGLKDTTNSSTIASSTSRLELIVDDDIVSVSKEDVVTTALPAVCSSPLLYDDVEQSSDDDEMNNLVIDENYD